MTSRRNFLALSASVAGSAALSRSGFAQRVGGPVFSNASTGAYTQGLMTRERFEKLVGSFFMVFLEKSQVAHMHLRAVNKIEMKAAALPTAGTAMRGKAPVAAIQPTAFELQFDVRGPSFPQDTYLLDHATLGRFALFLVPGSAGHCSATFCNFANSADAPTAPVRHS